MSTPADTPANSTSADAPANSAGTSAPVNTRNEAERFKPLVTANGLFSYHHPLLHRAVSESAVSSAHYWDLYRVACIAHRALWTASNWGPDYKPLPFGSFGLDNMVTSVGFALQLAITRGDISSSNEVFRVPGAAATTTATTAAATTETTAASSASTTATTATMPATVIDGKSAIEAYAAAVHDGWCANYRYWSTHEIAPPWRKPFKAFDGEERTRREACLVDYNALPEDEKIKDRVIAEAIVAWINGGAGNGYVCDCTPCNMHDEIAKRTIGHTQ